MQRAYELPLPGEPFDTSIFRLGKLCKRNHAWQDGLSLRTIKGKGCVLCSRIESKERHARTMRDAASREQHREERREYMRNYRAANGRPFRSKHGLPHGFLEANGFSNGQAVSVVKLLADGLTIEQIKEQIKERLLLDRYIHAAGAASVARLVYQQQMEHWRAHPEERREHLRQKALRNQRWRYMTDGSFRLYHRAKSKERKARERGSRTVMLTPDQLWRRWVAFDHSCAYCGATGDMQVEHVIPISKGGEHHLGNIVPACSRCNYSKNKQDMQTWYTAQPFFNQQRLNQILLMLAKGQPSTQQLSIRLDV